MHELLTACDFSAYDINSDKMGIQPLNDDDEFITVKPVHVLKRV